LLYLSLFAKRINPESIILSIAVLYNTNTLKGVAKDALLSALYVERRRLERGDLTEEERERVINEVKQRIANGEDPLDLLDDYGNRWMENKY